MKTVMFFVACVVLWGCAEKPEPMAEPPAGDQTSKPATNPANGGQDSIGVIGPEAGSSAVVTGSDTVTGQGGGSVGSAAKDQARKAGSKMGGSSLDQLGNDGN